MTLSVSNTPLLKRMEYFFKLYWKTICIALSLCFLSLLVLIGYGTYCDNGSFIEGAKQTGSPFWTMDYSANREGLGKTAVNMYKEVYEGGALEDLSRKLIINLNDSELQIGDTKLPVGNIFNSIHTIMVSIAVTVFSVLWLISFYTSFVNQQGYLELALKKLFILIAGIGMIAYSKDISQEICNLGSAIISSISSGVVENNPITTKEDELWDIMNGVGTTEAELEEEIMDEDAGIVDKMLAKLGNIIMFLPSRIGKSVKVNLVMPIAYILNLTIPWICVEISKIICSVFVITRGVEIAILTALSPIPFALVSNDPLGSGAGSRFIKNIAAISLQGAVMMVIFIICNAMTTGIAGGSVELSALTDSTWGIVGVYFAEIGLLMKSLSISQKVLGLA